jgi:hypothetical protein
VLIGGEDFFGGPIAVHPSGVWIRYVDSTFGQIEIPAERRRLSLLCVGYGYVEDKSAATPVLTRISNFQHRQFSSPRAGESFSLEQATPRRPQKGKPYLFATAGAVRGLESYEMERLQQLLQEDRPPQAVASKALEIGLAAAASPRSKGQIGKSWSSAIIPLDPAASIWVQYSTSTARTLQYTIDFVDASPGAQPVIGITDLRVETERPFAHSFPGTPRNAPCPCGSRKRYKRCHGAPGAPAAEGGLFINRLSSPDA